MTANFILWSKIQSISSMNKINKSLRKGRFAKKYYKNKKELEKNYPIYDLDSILKSTGQDENYHRGYGVCNGELHGDIDFYYELVVINNEVKNINKNGIKLKVYNAGDIKKPIKTVSLLQK